MDSDSDYDSEDDGFLGVVQMPVPKSIMEKHRPPTMGSFLEDSPPETPETPRVLNATSSHELHNIYMEQQSDVIPTLSNEEKISYKHHKDLQEEKKHIHQALSILARAKETAKTQSIKQYEAYRNPKASPIKLIQKPLYSTYGPKRRIAIEKENNIFKKMALMQCRTLMMRGIYKHLPTSPFRKTTIAKDQNNLIPHQIEISYSTHVWSMEEKQASQLTKVVYAYDKVQGFIKAFTRLNHIPEELYKHKETNTEQKEQTIEKYPSFLPSISYFVSDDIPLPMLTEMLQYGISQNLLYVYFHFQKALPLKTTWMNDPRVLNHLGGVTRLTISIHQFTTIEYEALQCLLHQLKSHLTSVHIEVYNRKALDEDLNYSTKSIDDLFPNAKAEKSVEEKLMEQDTTEKIKKIHRPCLYRDIIKLRNLQHLDLTRIYMDHEWVASLLDNYAQLKKIQLHHCQKRKPLDHYIPLNDYVQERHVPHEERSEELFKTTTHIDTLSLKPYYVPTRKPLRPHTELTRLVVEHANVLNNDNFELLVQHCPMLNHVSLSYCKYINAEHVLTVLSKTHANKIKRLHCRFKRRLVLPKKPKPKKDEENKEEKKEEHHTPLEVVTIPKSNNRDHVMTPTSPVDHTENAEKEEEEEEEEEKNNNAFVDMISKNFSTLVDFDISLAHMQLDAVTALILGVKNIHRFSLCQDRAIPQMKLCHEFKKLFPPSAALADYRDIFLKDMHQRILQVATHRQMEPAWESINHFLDSLFKYLAKASHVQIVI